MLGWQQGGTRLSSPLLTPQELKPGPFSPSQGTLLQYFASILTGPLAYVCVNSFFPIALYYLSLSGQLRRPQA